MFKNFFIIGADSQKVYDDIADYAKQKGVSVNVISMEGTDCKLGNRTIVRNFVVNEIKQVFYFSFIGSSS